MAHTKLFPVTVVGSWTRPDWLIHALRRRQAGEISAGEFDHVADEAVLAAIKYQEDAGVDIVSDGEMRRDNFYSFVVEKLGGMRLMKLSQLLTRSSWFEGLSDKAYPTREDLAKDVVKILRREVTRLKEMGVDFIQLDEPSISQVVYGDEAEQTFMCAALGSRTDPTHELEFAVRLVNETVDGIDGVKFGVHVCRGNWSRKENVLLSGNYGPLLPWLMRMDVDQLVLEMATPRAGEIEVFEEYRNEKEIVARVKDVLKYFDPDKIYLNPDCGFGTFAERCVNTADVAYHKLKAIHEAAEILRKEYE